MYDRDIRPLQTQRLRPLAACVAALFALSAPAAMATNRIVSSCFDDGGLGTLRSVIAAPTTVSGDTVDMSGLDCSGFGNKIALVSSGISVNQGSLTIKGPGSAALAIDASGLACSLTCSYRVLTHTGGGTLTLQNVGVSGGYERHTGVAAIGGCIASYNNGNVTLDHAVVSLCKAFTYATEHAYGGAVYAAGGALLKSSTVSGSSVAGSGITAGGGVFSKLGSTLDHSTISGNSVFSAGTQSVFGGGVAARGDLTIQTGALSGNSVNGKGLAQGGGAFSAGTMTLNYATLSGNTIESVADIALGGGARAYGGFAAAYSTVDGNQALGFAFAGGVSTYGSVTLSNSTISGNHADNNIGGLSAFDDANYANNFVTINNSTISGNSAGYAIGGIYTNAGTVGVYNSTIVLNTATKGKPSTEFLAPGLAIAAQQYAAITLQSTILSDNTYGSTELDISTAYNQVTIAGSGNLIRTEQAHVPNDSSNACPLLGPLRNNGGLTRTHALASNSPALDSGNALVAKDYDQRGSSTVNGAFDYLRISGKEADIGAYELQQDDVVFTTSFEGCLPIN